MPANRFHRSGKATLLIAAFCILFGDTGSAQYKSDPVAKVETRAFRQLQGQVRKILRGNVSYDAQAFNQWYSQLFIPAMTSPNPGALGKLAERRRTLLKDLNLASDNSQAHDALVNLIRQKALSVAGSNYHPSVKFNFVYLLGQLNDQEASIADRRPAVPHGAAFSVLVQLFADQQQTDPVRIAALLGMQRHVELRSQFPAESGELPAAEKTNAIQALVAITDAQEPPQGRSRAGHDWMRGVAAEMLGDLGDPNVTLSLGKLVSQSNASLSARCAAAKAIGQLEVSKSTVGADKMVAPFARLAADCCAAEQQALANLRLGRDNENEPPLAAPNRFESLLNPDNSDGPSFVDPQSVPSRRRLLSYLLDIRAGLQGDDGQSGLAKFAGEAANPVVQQIEATIAALRETSTTIVDLRKAIDQHTAQFERLAGAAGRATAAAATTAQK